MTLHEVLYSKDSKLLNPAALVGFVGGGGGWWWWGAIM